MEFLFSYNLLLVPGINNNEYMNIFQHSCSIVRIILLYRTAMCYDTYR